MNQKSNVHRIGAVASLSGVPVSTLRVWESRYGAFRPQKSTGSQRLYNDEDVLRASLLRQLTEAGHAISTVANLDASHLGALLYQQRSSARDRRDAQPGPRTVNLALVGWPLAMRIQSATFMQNVTDISVCVNDALKDLDEAADHVFAGRPDILMVSVNSLQMNSHTAIRHLAEKHQIPRVIVLYRFGLEKVIQAMKLAGMIVKREPVPDAELAELIQSVVLIDARQSLGSADTGVMIPQRKYSDETLIRVARISTDVLCECPRHVAELISQLVSFEKYSQDCLNKSIQDAHLHAQLSAISGSARALFERALEMVAQHEGIELQSL